ncbi:MAG: hypothetical protein VX949_01060 [Planctomycetota bacterium]|nr:hypothetical protein [Planctomycetota bacterium]
MNKLNALLVLLLFSSTPVLAQEYVLSISGPATAALGGDLDQSANFDNNGSAVAGWSYGVCHDSALMTINSAVDGATTLIVKNGSPPDFNQIQVSTQGYAVGVVICFTGCAVLDPGTGYELNVANYTADVEGIAASGYCDTIGSPPVETIIVVGGASVVPDQSGTTVEILGVPPVPDPEFVYSVPDVAVNYDGNTEEASFSAGIEISEVDHSASGAVFPNETQGFSMGLGHDNSLLESTNVEVTLPFDADFAESQIYSGGWTLGCVYSFTGGQTLAFDSAVEVVVADYSSVAGALSGATGPTATDLTWDNTLGSPPVEGVVVVNGASLTPTFDDGTITMQPVFDTPFMRGNCNGNSGVDISDGIWMLQELYLAGPSGTCAEACDANADGSYDMADPMHVIYWRLLDGPPPAAPFPDCGAVAGADCDAARYCP